jgi:hypothetical protein
MLQFSLPEEGGRPPKHVAETQYICYVLVTCKLLVYKQDVTNLLNNVTAIVINNPAVRIVALQTVVVTCVFKLIWTVWYKYRRYLEGSKRNFSQYYI